MKLKDINKTAGQQVQDWAVENQRLEDGVINLEANLCSAFTFTKTDQGIYFWHDVENRMTEQQLKLKYPNLHWKIQTPKEIAQSLLKGLSDEVLEEVRKLIK